MIDTALIWESLPNLLHGTLLSIQITAIAACMGFVLGSLFALIATGPFFALRCIVRAYVTLFRGTPMLIQILFFYYVLPQFGLTIAPLWAASIAIGLNSAAYMSEVIRTGICAVPKGQIEAAYTLGFTPFQTIRAIVFPQAIRVALPALGNELVTLVKDSSLASIIGVMELTKEASIIRSRTYDAFSILLAVALLYLVLTATLGWCIKKYENRVKQYA